MQDKISSRRDATEVRTRDVRALRRLLENNGARAGNGHSRRRWRRRYAQIVGQRVPPQIAISAEDLAAGGAVIGLNIRVREKMRLQVAPLIETPGADGTLVRRLLHMQNLVDSQRPALTESFATLGAFERFLLAVYVPVISQMILPSEGFATYVARIRPLVGMRPLMDQQIVALRELPVAELTNELFLGSGRTASPWYTRVHRDRGLLRGRGGRRRGGRSGGAT